ncbi:MAG: recombinase family protein [bacterium]|nr:recombinase family protein [bacterium]
MKKIGIYTRVSSQRQADIQSGSLDTQADRMRNYAKIRNKEEDPWEVVDIYREEGKSGKNIERAELQRMLADIKTGKINTVLCTKIDRITRSLLDFYKLWKIFEEHNVDFVTLEENFDSSTPNGRAMLKITLVFAELEREQTAKRTIEKMQWRAEQGFWNGGQVLGYTCDPENKGKLLKNEEEVKLVNLIYQTYSEVGSFLKTAESINTKGYRTKCYTSRRGETHGGRKFIDTEISRILRNPLYTGNIMYNGQFYQGKQEPIVPQSIWDEVQQLIRIRAPKRRGASRKRKHVFLFEGLLYCGWCGAHMTPMYCGGRNKKLYYYYQCTTNSHSGKEGCKMPYVPAEVIEQLMCERIRELGKNENLIKEIAEDNVNAYIEEINILQMQRRTLQSKLTAIDTNIDNWLELIGNGTAKKEGILDMIIRKMSDSSQQKKELENQIDELNLKIREIKEKKINIETMQNSLVKFSDLFDLATAEEKKILMQLIIHKLIYSPNEIKYALYDRPTCKEYIDKYAISDSSKSTVAVEFNKWLPE